MSASGSSTASLRDADAGQEERHPAVLRIVGGMDAELFYRAVGTIAEAEEARRRRHEREDRRPGASRFGTGVHHLDELKAEEIEAEILAAVQETALQVRDHCDQVGFKRLSLPETNIESVFEQMRAERARLRRLPGAGRARRGGAARDRPQGRRDRGRGPRTGGAAARTPTPAPRASSQTRPAAPSSSGSYDSSRASRRSSVRERPSSCVPTRLPSAF